MTERTRARARSQALASAGVELLLTTRETRLAAQRLRMQSAHLRRVHRRLTNEALRRHAEFAATRRRTFRSTWSDLEWQPVAGELARTAVLELVR